MNDDQIRSALTKGAPPEPDPAFVDRLEASLVAELAEPGRRGRPRLQALAAVATAVVFLLAGGYLLRPQPGVDEPATPSLLESPTSPSTTAPTTVPETPTSTATLASTWPGQIAGALPDGTPFVVFADEPPVVEGISAAIVLDRPDGSSQVIGITNFNRIGRAGEGEWRVDIDVYDDIRAELGGSVDGLVEVSEINGFPVLDLTVPLRFATDDEVPLQMAVQFEDFSVMRGCGPLAWRCSERGAVQMVPIDAVVAPAVQPDLTDVHIQSPASRWPADPSYVDPGPLSPRGGHFVGWTGSELLVYGGSAGDGNATLADGALFDPVKNTWRSMPPPPGEVVSSGAVWTGDELVVMSAAETLAYNPVNDEWRVAAGSAPTPGPVVEVVFDGTGVVVRLGHSSRAVARLDLDRGEWQELPDLPFGAADPSASILRVVDGAVYAVGLGGDGCSGVTLVRLVGADWVEVSTPSASGDPDIACSLHGDSAVVDGRLLFWESRDHPAAVYDPAIGEWTEIEPPPVGGCEGGSNSVVAASRVYVESCGAFAMFDAGTDAWSRVVLPGSLGSGVDAVWTGNDLLMWGAPCCYGTGGPLSSVDAWRWSPP